MNKSKIVLAAVGGVIGVATLAAAFLAWRAWSAKSEALDGGDSGEGLDSVVARAASLSRKDVYPCAESVRALDANREKFEEWKDKAYRLAADGDRPVDTNVTAAAFKEQLLFDAKRLSALPGTAEGAIVKPDFPFGAFREYILDGKLPPEAQLQKLQRQWEDVVFIFETLAKDGVGEVTGFEIAADAAPASEQQEQRKGQKKPKRSGKPAKEAKAPAKEIVENYTVQFAASPDAFVRVVNDFTVTNRFVVIEDFSFVRARDDVKEAFDAQEKKDVASSSSRRSRRSRRGDSGEGEEKKSESPREAAIRQGVVTDPALATPLSVVLKLSVKDFGTLLGGDNEEEEKK
jgi:hypothetical protein